MTDLIFEKSRPGAGSFTAATGGVSFGGLAPRRPAALARTRPLALPELPEGEVVRHYLHLSTLNHHVDKDFYPLGSCTMKYNPKVNDALALLPGFTGLHPEQSSAEAGGALRLLWELGEALKEISGMDAVTLQPVAGAHGELTALFMIRAWHEKQGRARRKVVIPDAAHGTNPASITMAGYEVVQVKSAADGCMDLAALKAALDEDVAAFMITNPNTVGIFERHIVEINAMVHEVGALSYMDGANLNALLGIVKAGELGFDVMHINLHKTFSVPHGGGGPGAGPLVVKGRLAPFLPSPLPVLEEGRVRWRKTGPDSIGKVHAYFGNFGALVRAHAYIRRLGAPGLKRVAENAIINANYVRAGLQDLYRLGFPGIPLHEVVFSAVNQKKLGYKASHIAKRLLDFGMHAPTTYFPLIVPEALMVEPTETESRATLDRFIAAMRQIHAECEAKDPLLDSAPNLTPVRKLDDVRAVKQPRLRWRPEPAGHADSA
ncbi:MAG: aminomethyl-transferring glycine dehydrogenase subunit GcvPB [bacterium]|jgi:glycine dehydrogenase subunit 2|nr:aminomethyl-transferring glycine dehydrogenase subunit GcvPB [bacterium]